VRGPFVSVGDADAWERRGDGVRVRTGSTLVEVTALAADLFRVGMFVGGRPARYDSPAVARVDWPSVGLTIDEDQGAVTLATDAATARIGLSPLRISFGDSNGRMLAADDAELGMGCFPDAEDDPAADPLGPPVRLYKQRQPGDRYYGCGERTGGLEKTGSYQMFWNIDPLPGHGASHDNLYSSVPFTLVLNNGAAWGLLVDSTTLVDFDLGRQREDRAWFGAWCGNLVYYVFTGPTPRDVLDRYTELTGRTPMPPLWALGNHQSRYSYMSGTEVRELVREFREREIPCDAVYLDIDALDGYRDFTFNPQTYPEPAQLFSDLHELGMKVVSIVDAGVKVDEGYSLYIEGRERDLYCKTNLGEEYHNVVWPGMAAFPDFTNPRTREWWGDAHQGILDTGIDGVWNDMNEPSMFVPSFSTMPPEVIHPGGGRPTIHAQVHNSYGMLMSQGTREGLLRLRPERRPFVISRSGYAGLQRHAMQWTGDNSSWWEHLWMSMPQVQNMGLSGIAWVGVDVGGFFGDTTGELLTRWYELGIFQPFLRNHAAKGARPQEPWAFGEPYESIIRDLLTLRQRLIPYLYTLFEECHRTGAPIFRPLLFEFPDDPTTYAIDDQFLLGGAMLVAPITRPGREYRHVYLPAGSWSHWYTGDQIDGPAHIIAHAPLGQPAIYARGNHAIPLWPAMQHTGERDPDPLTLVVYPVAGSASTTIYEDAGDGFAYQHGQYARTTITSSTAERSATVLIGQREGGYAPPRSSIEVELRGLLEKPLEVRVDGVTTDFDWNDTGTVAVRFAATADSREVAALWDVAE
jgi:alpha-glucosidase